RSAPGAGFRAPAGRPVESRRGVRKRLGPGAVGRPAMAESMVEAAGIEPASERSSAESPTSLSGLLYRCLARVAPAGGIAAHQPVKISSAAHGRGFGPACDCLAPAPSPTGGVREGVTA